MNRRTEAAFEGLPKLDDYTRAVSKDLLLIYQVLHVQINNFNNYSTGFSPDSRFLRPFG